MSRPHFRREIPVVNGIEKYHAKQPGLPCHRLPAVLRHQFEIVGRRLPAPILDNLVFDLLPFEQRCQSRPLHRGDMDEFVLRPIIGLNEAESLVWVEPFYGSCGHE